MCVTSEQKPLKPACDAPFCSVMRRSSVQTEPAPAARAGWCTDVEQSCSQLNKDAVYARNNHSLSATDISGSFVTIA